MKKSKELKAPYIPTRWLTSALDLLRRMKLDKVDRNVFARDNIASPGNASKIVSALKFFSIVDNENNVIQERAKKLKLQGEPYIETLKEIVKEAYADVFERIDILKAEEQDLSNYFISKYDFSQSTARQASILFVFLCKKAEINLSPDLKNLDTFKSRERIIKKVKDAKTPTREKNKGELKGYLGDNIFLIKLLGRDDEMTFKVQSLEDLEKAFELIKSFIEIKLKKE